MSEVKRETLCALRERLAEAHVRKDVRMPYENREENRLSSDSLRDLP